MNESIMSTSASNERFASSSEETTGRRRHDQAFNGDGDSDDDQRHQEAGAAPTSWFSRRIVSTDSGSSFPAKMPSPNENDGIQNPTDGRKIRSISTGSVEDAPYDDTNTNLGMVSDNEDDEGFNFVAVSTSLLMASRSFEHVSSDSNNNDDTKNNEKLSLDNGVRRGVLIVDGSDDTPPSLGAAATANGNHDTNNHNDDSDTLTIPGSDSLPSDLGTISHHDDELLFGEGSETGHRRNHGSGGVAGQVEDPYHPRNVSYFCHFLTILKQSTPDHRLRSDSKEEGGESKDRTAHRCAHDDDRAATSSRRYFCGYSVAKISGFVLATTLLTLFAWAEWSSIVNRRRQQEEWEQRLLQEEQEKVLLLAEREKLRLEMELLQEEAAFATARADSLVKEQERWRLLQEAERSCEHRRQQHQIGENQHYGQKRRQNKHQVDGNDGGDGWFFDDKSKEDCAGTNGDDGSTTFSIADNCWFNAKTNVKLGSCGDETKEFLKDFWNGLWDWDEYFGFGSEAEDSFAVEPYGSSSTNGQDKHDGGSNFLYNDHRYDINGGSDQTSQYHHNFQDDSYYPPQDPLQDLFSVFQSFGHSFVTKFSQLLQDDTNHAQTTAQDLEGVARRGYSDANNNLSDAMEFAKDDMRGLSNEALTTLRTAVNINKEDHDRTSSNQDDTDGTTTRISTISTTTMTQPVTQKGLLDAAAALSSLSKAWQESTTSLSTVQDDTREKNIAISEEQSI
jgi:hypothetical protein